MGDEQPAAPPDARAADAGRSADDRSKEPRNDFLYHFEDRFGIRIEAIDARSQDGPWSAEHCCGQAKVDALERALSGVEAWITGIRREQAPTRASAPKLEEDAKRGIWKVNPLADWSEKDVWNYIHRHDLPYHPLHDRGFASIGCAPCTQPGQGRAGRWTGQDKTECGIHL